MMAGKATGLLESLRRSIPDWPTGLAGRGLMLHHLTCLGRSCTSPEMADLMWHVATWRWMLLPWDRQTAELCRGLAAICKRPGLPEWTRTPSDESNAAFCRTLQAIAEDDLPVVTELWENHGRKTALSHAWLGEVVLFCLQRGAEEHARRILSDAALPPSHPLLLHLRALFAFCFSPPETALREACNLPAEFALLSRLLQTEILIRNGQPEGTVALRDLWKDAPWHPNITLKLHALARPSRPGTPDCPDTAILLYSWNNADMLDQTLESLHGSDIGQARLFVLDNGSDDHTPDIVSKHENLFGERFQSLRLPVNIGAPAARNWLLRHPSTAPFRHVAFVDDDVTLPPDWFRRLLDLRRQSPPGAVLGCRIADPHPHNRIQMVDLNLMQPENGSEFLIANSARGELDIGLHDYERPCLSVTGCCHMLDREGADRLGGFDLRFGPSQFDDFDFDLRNALAGGHAVYTGKLAVRHHQRSRSGQAGREARDGHGQGNMIKLNAKYTAAQKADLLRKNRDLLWNDLLAKTRDLENL